MNEVEDVDALWAPGTRSKSGGSGSKKRGVSIVKGMGGIKLVTLKLNKKSLYVFSYGTGETE